LHPYISIALAIAAVFFVSDFVYALDHYLVHYDRERYKTTHIIHHVRYGGVRKGPHLDHSELSTYGTAAFMSLMPTSVLTLLTGNPGFFIGALLKFLHTLIYHHYQHGWWSEVNVKAQKQGKPKPTWGLAHAKYHAWHHSNPDDLPLTVSESWAGFDRILELLHPWLYRYVTVDGRKEMRKHRRQELPPKHSTPDSGAEA
jgi:hypothetical protein